MDCYSDIMDRLKIRIKMSIAIANNYEILMGFENNPETKDALKMALILFRKDIDLADLAVSTKESEDVLSSHIGELKSWVNTLEDIIT